MQIRVKAVEGRYPHPNGIPGRYLARGPLPACEALPEGELIEDSSDLRTAVAQGSLAVVDETGEHG